MELTTLLTFEIKDRKVTLNLFEYEGDYELVTNFDLSVTVFSRKTGKLLQGYRLPTFLLDELKQLKSYTALVRYAKANQIEQSTIEQPIIEQSTIDSVCSTSCPAPVPVPAESAQGQGIPIAECDRAIDSESVSNTRSGDDPIHCHQNTLFIDVETTGLSYNDEVVEIAIVDINENVIFESLVKPSKPIPDKSIKIHSINNAMVSNAPTFAEIWHDFSNIVHGKTLIFYNRAFDTRMIYQSALKSFGKFDLQFGDVIPFDSLFDPRFRPKHSCLMLEYAEFWGEWNDYYQNYKWQSLISACKQQGIIIDDVSNHRALGDAIKTARLYKFINDFTIPEIVGG